MLNQIILTTFPAGLVLAAVSDVLTMKIPNRISVGLVLLYVLASLSVSLPWAQIGWAFAAAGVVFLGCFALFAANVMGGGDAKLLTAAALWYGFDPSLISFLASVALMGGFVTVLVLIIRWKASNVLAIGIPLPHSLVDAKKIPYGVAIALGGLLTIEATPLFHAVMGS
ncbi:A24 family peptidase [Rhizobium oryzicola]|uniref:Prepilin peptidase n=1 Tax=Rhizobium oryzicola TaxID=1232668 RepID=A0ABT8SQ93_9HYPH|nr:prepilin peptidase [Rhizobium oryzicola]MDO1580650.1 prepilin peptidase [Rhizobium oryzicola]